MYHDQALIPIKTLAFDHAVNVTLGLPFVRTSPDHGTAFDIAGTGRADPSSLIAALTLAARLAARDAPALGRRAMMAQIDDLPPLREVIRRHGLSAKKSLGQNFLLDLNLTGAHRARRRAARRRRPWSRSAPGPGGLTRALLADGARRVIAIERDERAIAALEEIAARYPGRLEIVAGDALDFDAAPHLGGGRARVVANLPYNIATALLIGWLTAEPWPPWYDRLVLMFQREVAERIVAAPGSKTYGRLSVLAGWRTRGEDPVRRRAVRLRAAAQGDLVGGAADPARAAAAPATAQRLQRVTEAAFGQRRKMLRQSLKSLGVDPLRAARRGRHRADRARRGNSGRRLRRARQYFR